MKNTTKYLTLFAGAVALISCGSGPSKGETISKMIETIEKDNQFETDMGGIKYATHKATELDNIEFDVYFLTDESDRARFDVRILGYYYGYAGRLDVTFTDSNYPVEGAFMIYRSTTYYFTASFTLNDNYTIGSEKYKFAANPMYDSDYVNLATGTKMITTGLKYALTDLKQYMTMNDMDIKVFIPEEA